VWTIVVSFPTDPRRGGPMATIGMYDRGPGDEPIMLQCSIADSDDVVQIQLAIT
jgi:hypothetical protein